MSKIVDTDLEVVERRVLHHYQDEVATWLFEAKQPSPAMRYHRVNFIVDAGNMYGFTAQLQSSDVPFERRPSRGWARHLRRLKARERRG